MEERARIPAKGWLARAGKNVEKMIVKQEETSEWLAETTSVLKEFNKQIASFEEAQAAVEAFVEEKDIMEEIERADTFKDSFSKMKAKLEVMISSHRRHHHMTMTADVKLPKLDLPVFKGEYEHCTMADVLGGV